MTASGQTVEERIVHSDTVPNTFQCYVLTASGQTVEEEIEHSGTESNTLQC
jgi:hypothetical protein